ncbi:glutathione S-transferase N-terminal domain-containing protein [Limnohabitans sp. Rim8]|uniref:glutathione S-transferase family protein n=1 Tax=Limnohabitans sp. Rim8 TaxID=1100718 RepID=UPI00262DE178|nr:glutathione S-transferase N-terminal domain-containing protein [Limnohabitans sp. Rim8]
MALTLFAFDTPNARKVTVALEEMGLSYAVQVVDITRDEQFAPDFLKISPNNKIPALVDTDGFDGQTQTVFESGAILIYLAEKTGQFLPSRGAGRVAALEWLMFQMGGFGPAPGQVHHFVALKDETDKRYGLQRFMAETLRLYGVMDRRLAEQPFFAGDLSIADFAILGWVWRHPRHQVDLAQFPHVQRWYQSLMARPAVQKGFAVALRRD